MHGPDSAMGQKTITDSELAPITGIIDGIQQAFSRTFDAVFVHVSLRLSLPKIISGCTARVGRPGWEQR